MRPEVGEASLDIKNVRMVFRRLLDGWLVTDEADFWKRAFKQIGFVLSPHVIRHG